MLRLQYTDIEVQLAIFLCIVLADKGHIGNYKVTVSAIANIHSYLDRLGS